MELIQASYSELSTLRARFQQESYLAALDVAEASSGEVWFEHPGKMRWHYTSPEEQDFVVVDDTFWFYQLEDRQVTIDTFKSVALSDLPIAFLMGLGDLRRDFQLVKACMGATPAGDELVILHLRDKGSKETTGEGAGSDGIQGLVLAVGAQSSLPIGAQVQHLGGNSTSVLFEESKVKGSFSPETFKLSWPKSVDVIDRR
jgi:outer membrane lipoprotein-sorting protein